MISMPNSYTGSSHKFGLGLSKGLGLKSLTDPGCSQTIAPVRTSSAAVLECYSVKSHS